MSERSGDCGAWLGPGVGSVLKAGSLAKTMTSPINYTDRVMLRFILFVLFNSII